MSAGLMAATWQERSDWLTGWLDIYHDSFTVSSQRILKKFCQLGISERDIGLKCIFLVLVLCPWLIITLSFSYIRKSYGGFIINIVFSGRFQSEKNIFMGGYLQTFTIYQNGLNTLLFWMTEYWKLPFTYLYIVFTLT